MIVTVTAEGIAALCAVMIMLTTAAMFVIRLMIQSAIAAAFAGANIVLVPLCAEKHQEIERRLRSLEQRTDHPVTNHGGVGLG